MNKQEKGENKSIALGLNFSPIENLVEEFRRWTDEWARYEEGMARAENIPNKPKSVDGFIADINKLYVVGFTSHTLKEDNKIQ